MQTTKGHIHLGKAIPLAIGATLCLSFAAATVKFGNAKHLSTSALIFWRNLISLALLLPWVSWKAPLKTVLETKEWKLHWIRGIASFTSVFLYFWSLQFLGLASATALLNTLPIFVPIVVRLWLKIPIPHKLWKALAIAFLGILLVVQPELGIFNWASLLALGSGIFGAIASVALRIGHYSETPKTLMLHLFTICLVLAIPCTLLSFQESFGNFSFDQLAIYLPLGLFGFGYQFLWTFAARFAPMRLLSPFLYLAVIFGILLDQMFWSISINVFQISGFVLIVIGILLMLYLYPKNNL